MATTSDVFNAVAEPQRREILDLLTQGELSVNEVATSLGLRQPRVSKHLRVLREGGLLSVRSSGQLRFLTLSGEGLRPIHDRVERFWSESDDRPTVYLDEIQRQEKSDEHPD